VSRWPHLYVAISAHGLGHVSRTLAVIQAFMAIQPHTQLTLVTPAPPSVLRRYLDHPFHYRPVSLDVGVVQRDSLVQDVSATRSALEALARDTPPRVAQEVAYIRATGVHLIFADIPAMAGLIAQQAGVPCVMASNFGWDFIYRHWGADFAALAEQYAAGYRYCQRLFRLPFAEAMSAFANPMDVGLTGQNPRVPVSMVRQQLEITTPPERTVLLAFGGLGIQGVPYGDLERFPDWCFLSFDPQAPALPNLRRCHAGPLRPVDVMPLCGKVVTKPGYSTYSEAYRLGVPIYSLERRGFAEAEVLLAGLRTYCWHQVVTLAEFTDHPWEFLTRDPLPPQSSDRLATDGNEKIAMALQDYVTG